MQLLLAHDHLFRNEEYVKDLLSKLDVPVWVPTNEKIDLGEEKSEEKKEEVVVDAMDVESVGNGGQQQGGGGGSGGSSNDEAERQELATLVKTLEEWDVSNLAAEPAEFEKDQVR